MSSFAAPLGAAAGCKVFARALALGAVTAVIVFSRAVRPCTPAHSTTIPRTYSSVGPPAVRFYDIRRATPGQMTPSRNTVSVLCTRRAPCGRSAITILHRARHEEGRIRDLVRPDADVALLHERHRLLHSLCEERTHASSNTRVSAVPHGSRLPPRIDASQRRAPANLSRTSTTGSRRRHSVDAAILSHATSFLCWMSPSE
eukprot:1293910-Prymnesium_polylepis.2